MAIISGNLDQITESAKRLVQSADKALDTTKDSTNAGDELAVAIKTSTDALMTRFNQIALDLKEDIAASHRQLEATDWQGQSRDNAIAIKQELEGQVGTVLEQAATALGAEQTAFVDRAQALVDEISGSFGNVMNQVNERYGELATAADQMRTNLEAADQTIKVG